MYRQGETDMKNSSKKTIVRLSIIGVLVLVLVSCKHEHKFGEWETYIEASCGSNGEQIRKCSCGATETKNLPAVAHTWKPATCMSPMICKTCGEELVVG